MIIRCIPHKINFLLKVIDLNLTLSCRLDINLYIDYLYLIKKSTFKAVYELSLCLLLFTPMSITPLIGMEDAHIVLNVYDSPNSSFAHASSASDNPCFPFENTWNAYGIFFSCKACANKNKF